MSLIEVCLVDDHNIFAIAVKAMLKSETDISIVESLENGKQLINILSKRSFDLILLDLTMPVMTGLEALEIVGEKYPDQLICILSCESDESTIYRALELGAVGFVSKKCNKETLINAIHCTAKGEQYLGSEVSKLLYENYRHVQKYGRTEDNAVDISLSSREIEVLKLLTDGLKYKEIAKYLFISARTVESHKNNILKKLGLQNNIQLVKFAIKHEIIQL